MNRTSDEEKRPFLDDQSSTSESSFELRDSRTRCCRRTYHPFLVLTVAVGLLISLASNVGLLFYIKCSDKNASLTKSSSDIQIPFSPADPHIEFELKSIDTHDDYDPFIGPPGPEFDQAWSDLLSPTSMLVTPDELRKAGKQSLRLRDGENESYLAYLETYHQLHCVKRMVQNRWPERYQDLVVLNALSDDHFNHCIQVLRKGIMCNGDTSLNTFTWDPKNSTHMIGISDAPRKCINWERMDSWARSRATGAKFDLYAAGEEGWMGPTLD